VLSILNRTRGDFDIARSKVFIPNPCTPGGFADQPNAQDGLVKTHTPQRTSSNADAEVKPNIKLKQMTDLFAVQMSWGGPLERPAAGPVCAGPHIAHNPVLSPIAGPMRISDLSVWRPRHGRSTISLRLFCLGRPPDIAAHMLRRPLTISCPSRPILTYKNTQGHSTLLIMRLSMVRAAMVARWVPGNKAIRHGFFRGAPPEE
jgi:hypothetical protein